MARARATGVPFWPAPSILDTPSIIFDWQDALLEAENRARPEIEARAQRRAEAEAERKAAASRRNSY